jgi:GNAT superfamily N-acetyltransferase
LFVEGRIASFGATLRRPHPVAKDIYGLSRLVTLPDWQGLGLAMILSEKLGAAYAAIGERFHTYPAHPSLIRAFDKSSMWALEKRPGIFQPQTTGKIGLSKLRPCAIFSYAGEKMDEESARRLIQPGH